MKMPLLTLFALILLKFGTAQNYTVSLGTSNYDTLTTYTQLNAFNGQNIQFGFKFPFFDTAYNQVELEFSGYGSLPGSPNYNLYLYAGDFWPHKPQSGIRSDWRYWQGIYQGDSLLKVEWRNAGIGDDIFSASPTDHRINFQVWVYKSGIIELHFGEVDLLNTPYYSDTSGFIWPDGESYGPWIEIGNFDLSEVYCVSGNNNNPVVITVEDSSDIYYDTPVEGQYFRWTPDELLGFESTVIRPAGFKCYPNPAKGHFTIDLPDQMLSKGSITITDITGSMVMRTDSPNRVVPIENLSPGIYIVTLHSGTKAYQSKLVVL